MRMIVGGAFQGKFAYAKERYPDIKWIDGAVCEPEQIYTCGGIRHFHLYIRRILETESTESLWHYITQLQNQNPDIIIISDEIGSGLVPTDAFERAYREQVGRICTALAGYSERVDRVICGIGAAIKGDES